MQPDRHQPLRWEPVRIERPWMDEPRDAVLELRAETRRTPRSRWGRRRENSRFYAWAAHAAEIVSRAAREWRRQAQRMFGVIFRRRGSLEHSLDRPPGRFGMAWPKGRITLASALYILPVLAGGLGIVAVVQQFQDDRLTRSPKSLDAALSRAAPVETAQAPSKPAMPDFSVIDTMPKRELVQAEASTPQESDSPTIVSAKSVAPENVGATESAEPAATDADQGPDAEKVAVEAEEPGTAKADTAQSEPEAEEAEQAETDEKAERQGGRSRRSERRTATRTPNPPSPAPEEASPAFVAQASTGEAASQPVSTAATATAAVSPEEKTGKAQARGSAVQQAEAHLQAGDVMTARRLLRPGAWANDAAAIQLLAQTYDPNVLARVKAKRGRPDVATARKLYSRAKALGAAGGDPGR